jgi:hypothetical protein
VTGFFEDHLNLDSIVAFVDGELSLTAYQRAAAHISACSMCAADVAEQSFARDSLRSASAPQMPGSLVAALFSIPVALPVAVNSPGVGIDSRTGYAIRVSHIGREVTRSRRFRLGASALVAGIAVGAFATTGSAKHEEPVVVPDTAGTIEPASYAPANRPSAPPLLLDDAVTTVSPVVTDR